MTRKNILISAAIAIALAAAYGAGGRDANVDAVDVAVAEPTSSPSSTPSPTPSPTPEPTLPPTPYPVLASEWVEFLAWGTASLTECDPSVLQYAMQAYDDVTAYVESESLGRCYKSNLDWIDSHPALPCYQAIWTKTRDFFSNAKQSMSYSSRFWYEYPYGDVDDLQSTLTYLQRATDSVQDVSGEMDSASADDGFCYVAVTSEG